MREWVCRSIAGIENVTLFLKEPLVRMVDERYPGEPLYGRHAVPTWYDQPQRIPMILGQRLAVHLVGQKHFMMHRLVDR